MFGSTMFETDDGKRYTGSPWLDFCLGVGGDDVTIPKSPSTWSTSALIERKVYGMTS